MDPIRHRTLATLTFLVLAALPAFADRAAAQRAVAEGEAQHQRGNFEGATSAYSRAIDADPSWDLPWGRRGTAKLDALRGASSMEDFGRALEIAPDSYEWRIFRAQAALYLDQPDLAIEDMDHLLTKMKDYPDALAVRGFAKAMAGQVDDGLLEQDRALQLSGNDPRLLMRAEGLMRKADWGALVSDMDKRIAAGVAQGADIWYRTVGLVEAGRYDDAAAAVAGLGRFPGTVQIAGGLWLKCTPAAGKHHDPAAARQAIVQLSSTSGDSNALVAAARGHFMLGDARACADLLATKGRRAHFGVVFWLGAAHWKLGELAEARRVLLDARRLNPHLLKHAQKIEGFADFAASIDKELAGEKGGDTRRLGHELATHLLTVAEIEALVRRYEFGRAAAEYRKLVQSLTSAVRKAEVEARLPEVEAMAAAHGKLVAAVNKGAKPKATVGKSELVIVKATDLAFDFTIAGGSGKFPWAYLEPALYATLVLAQPLTPEETFGLGCLLWETGQATEGTKQFEAAAKKKAPLRDLVDAFVSRRRGLAVPYPRFVVHKGVYVTPDEKSNLDKGLVLFEGQWVTPKDREQLARGLVKAGDQWMDATEADLLRRGFRKIDGKWLSAEDVQAMRGVWATAWIEETTHFRIRSNESEALIRDLAALAESAYADFRAFYGDEPKLPAGEKMELWAFASYEDYRRHCVETRAEGHLNAAGFARSDSNVVVGWNKTRNRQQFLQTMIHEAAHLYWFRIAPAAQAPSWFAEGMATYFEGFSWDGKAYVFNHLSESRLPFARDAMKAGRHIPLTEMLSGDALALINSDIRKALLFYAQCWALHFYLSTTENKVWREAYAAYIKSVRGGAAKGLLEFFPDPAALEKDWIRFVSGL